MYEKTINQVFADKLPVSKVQCRRLSRVSVAMLLASHVQLSQIATWLSGTASHDAQIQVVRRLLDGYVLDVVWLPFVKAFLQSYHSPTWHLIMDRTSLGKDRDDLLLISLAYRRRALPLVWQRFPHGSTSASQQISLWEQVLPLLPKNQPIIAHGDTEFGAVPVMRWMQQQNWHFILAQQSNTYYRPSSDTPWQLLSTIVLPPGPSYYCADIEWTKHHGYGPLNLCAFHMPHQNGVGKKRYEMRYLVSNLPITCPLRRVGRRRFGIECFIKDIKSGGFQFEASALSCNKRLDSLLILSAMLYWWTTCVGRWVCKTGQRSLIDTHSKRQLSFFHIGRLWLVRQYRESLPWRPISTLYA